MALTDILIEIPTWGKYLLFIGAAESISGIPIIGDAIVAGLSAVVGLFWPGAELTKLQFQILVMVIPFIIYMIQTQILSTD